MEQLKYYIKLRKYICLDKCIKNLTFPNPARAHTKNATKSKRGVGWTPPPRIYANPPIL